jgi:hypothetical protein
MKVPPHGVAAPQGPLARRQPETMLATSLTLSDELYRYTM